MMPGRHAFRAGAPATLAVLAIVASCASAGMPPSGIVDRDFSHAPYYSGGAESGGEAGATVTEVANTGHLPIAYQRGATQAPVFDPSGSGPMAELLAAMNAFVDSLGINVPLVDGGGGPHDPAPGRGAPDVRFGCASETGPPGDPCGAAQSPFRLNPGRTMRLVVFGPSREWITWSQEAMDRAGVGRILVITVEVGQYLSRRAPGGLSREVELGTGYVRPLPALHSPDAAVGVVQLTGVVVGRDGRGIRGGAEGLLAHPGPLPVRIFTAQNRISDDDVREILSARRDDLPGQPLVWQVSLRNLVCRLVEGVGCG